MINFNHSYYLKNVVAKRNEPYRTKKQKSNGNIKIITEKAVIERKDNDNIDEEIEKRKRKNLSVSKMNECEERASERAYDIRKTYILSGLNQ